MLRIMRRREFLTLSVASIGGVLVYSLDHEVFRLSAQVKQSIRIPLRFLSQAEALIVAAAASRIFPSDEAGPGAREAGVAVYIDRQLAGPWGRDLHRYTQGPFEDSVMLREASWSRSNSFWGTFRCKRPNATLAANSRFDQPSMIALASSRILELGVELGRGCRPLANN